MGSRQPKTKELIVKAEYFVGIEPTEENPRNLQNKLIQIMREEGFETDNVVLPYVPTDRTLEFIRIPLMDSKSNSIRYNSEPCSSPVTAAVSSLNTEVIVPCFP